MIYKMLKYSLLAGLAVLAAGCSSEDAPEAAANEPVELKLELSVTGQVESRGFGLDTRMAEGICIALLVEDAVTREHVENRFALVNADGTIGGWGDLGTWGESIENIRPLYFPVNGNPINLYAVTAPGGNLWQANWDWPTDFDVFCQTTMFYNVEEYGYEDILFAKKTSVAPTKSSVQLPFNHIMAKIEVTLSGPSDLIKALELTNVTCWPYISWNGTEFTMTHSYSTKVSKVYLNADLSPEINEAVVMPQTIAKGTDFILITLNNGTALAWEPDEDLVLEGGYKYRFNVTISEADSGMAVTTSMADWNNTESAHGVAYPNN